MSPEETIQLLELSPHPEGGYYRRTYENAREHDGRPLATSIYYLLKHDERSHWHRIDADELWHYYAGAPLELSIHAAGQSIEKRILGPDLAAGQRPQILVESRIWQAARTLGDWTLVGATVSPGFVFAGFELAPPDWSPPMNGSD